MCEFYYICWWSLNFMDPIFFIYCNRISVGTQDANIVGTCLICHSSFDDYSSRCRCSYCRMVVLVCYYCQVSAASFSCLKLQFLFKVSFQFFFCLADLISKYQCALFWLFPKLYIGLFSWNVFLWPEYLLQVLDRVSMVLYMFVSYARNKAREIGHCRCYRKTWYMQISCLIHLKKSRF